MKIVTSKLNPELKESSFNDVKSAFEDSKDPANIVLARMTSDGVKSFTKFSLNRSHRDSHLQSLQESIRSEGQKERIKVIYANIDGIQDFYVTDGHGRLEAMEGLDMAFDVEIKRRDDVTTIMDYLDEVVSINLQDPWGINEFAFAFAGAGYSFYITAINIYDQLNKTISITLFTVMKLLMEVSEGSISHLIKTGKFEINNYQHAMKTGNLAVTLANKGKIQVMSRMVESLHMISKEQFDYCKFATEYAILKKDIEDSGLKLDNYDTITRKALANVREYENC